MEGFIKYIGISSNGLNFAKVVGTDGKEYYFDSRSLELLRMSDFLIGDVISFEHGSGNRLISINKTINSDLVHRQSKNNDLLNKIKNWSIEASNEDESYFYSTDEMKDILGGHILYVIGRKGTGKTAIVNSILKSDDKNTHSLKLSFKNFPFNLLYECVDEDYVQPNQYISIWQLIIYRKLSSLLIQDKNIEKTVKIKIQKLLDYSDEKTSRLLKRIDEFSVGLNVLGNGLNFGLSKNKINLSWTVQLDNYKELFNELNLSGHYYILFDELDEDYKEFIDEKERKKYISMLTSLFKAVKYVKQNCSNCIIPLVFLRTDIYNQLTDSDKNKWSENIVSLEWNLEKIKNMLAYRISKTTNNHDSTINANFDYEFAKIFNPRVIYSGNKKSKAISVFSYIARSTQWRPRDFIKYIKICAEEACSMGMEYATNEIVKSADAKFSDYLKQEIIDEIFPVLPEINKILSLFSSIRKQSFNPSIFIEEYNKEIEKGNIKKISAENVLGTLFNYNIIGNIPSMKGQVLYKYAFKDARFNLKENIIVHRGLYKALQIF